MDVKKYEQLHDRVLIKPTPPEETIGSFLITGSEKEQKQEGLVIAVGTGVPLHNIKLDISGQATPEVLDRLEKLILLIKEGRPMKVTAGDYVMYGKYSGTEVKIENEKYVVVREGDVFMKIKKD